LGGSSVDNAGSSPARHGLVTPVAGCINGERLQFTFLLSPEGIGMKVTAREMDVICHALNVACSDMCKRADNARNDALAEAFSEHAKGFNELADKLQEQLDEEVWGG